jgi:hypothetical protein
LKVHAAVMRRTSSSSSATRTVLAPAAVGMSFVGL